MKRYLLSALPCLFIFFISCQQRENLPPPNILWIVSEDNGPFLGCYGDSLATTPHLDQLASEGILYLNAYANAPVCAPNRATLITGMYTISTGIENMRSTFPVPEFIKFYPQYLKEKGYYTSNNKKKDYNTTDQPEVWDESSGEATYLRRKPGQPFFSIFNLTTTHEGCLHKGSEPAFHDPEKVRLPPYHPDTKEMRNDWAVYYDRIKEMDGQAGEILQQLEDEGLAEHTIVFYYSDHGGAVARSKRFLFESGLKVPLMVRIPEPYKHLAPQPMGTKSDQRVAFVDLAPTLLNLAGIEIPDHMQGTAFLGENIPKPQPYAFASRARMDERIDLSRSVTDGRYRYTRNFMPHRPYAQYIQYLWRAPSMQSWENQFKTGNLNDIQKAFFLTKPYEELYDLSADPHNVHNLVDNPNFSEHLTKLRTALDQWQLENRDAGLMPETLLTDLSEEGTIYDLTHRQDYPIEFILNTAKMAASKQMETLHSLTTLLSHENPVIRYWAATGCAVLKEQAKPAMVQLTKSLNDPSPTVSIAAAEALYYLNDKKQSIDHLISMLEHKEILVRLQALNVLETLEEDAKEALPVIQEIIRPIEDREYDNRAMWRLVEKFDFDTKM